LQIEGNFALRATNNPFFVLCTENIYPNRNFSIEMLYPLP